MKLSDDVTCLKGVGQKKKEALELKGISKVEDLLAWYPRKYEDRRNVSPISGLKPGDEVLVEAAVVSRRYRGYTYGKKSPLTLLADDGTGRIEIVFFNGSYLSNYFNISKAYTFYGTVTENNGRLQMIHPEFHRVGDEDDIRGILPVYREIKGLSQKELRKLMTQALQVSEEAEEWMPEDIVREYRICSPSFAWQNIHFPTDARQVLMSRFRMVFEELLLLETGLIYVRRGSDDNKEGVRIDCSTAGDFINSLPFRLTEGQEQVWRDIRKDLEGPGMMNRLIQGDVGSGKTAVAEIAMFSACRSGYQSVMMAPTEILAGQHYDTLRRDLEPFGIRVGLLSGSLPRSERKKLLESLKAGEIDVLTGTHAVLQPDVEFHDLGLVVTDEQHRFGVSQRRLISEKGDHPNVMVMTATPIPRTLAVILYGDLAVSAIHTMPEGRKPVRTFEAGPKERSRVYKRVKQEMDAGRQCYVVCPLIEESEQVEARSAEEVYKELCKKFPEKSIGLLHGQVSPEEKDRIMGDFAAGRIDLLVATVVIEIGINVPNATVMVIENAERFGLAQMHQLRGRVGRGSDQSFCFLILNKDTEIAAKRVKIMCETTDGFRISEEDLELRGPGEIFGTRQHGLPELHISDIVRHKDVLEKAGNAARDILDADPWLRAPEHSELRRRVEKLFGGEIRLDL